MASSYDWTGLSQSPSETAYSDCVCVWGGSCDVKSNKDISREEPMEVIIMISH